MRLYAWKPEGHGPLSFFVMAKSEDAAKKSINNFIANMKKNMIPIFGLRSATQKVYGQTTMN